MLDFAVIVYRLFAVSTKIDITIRVGNRIRELRTKQMMTQEKLAELSDVDYKHIQLLEGKHPSSVRISTLESICRALGVTLKEFFSGEEFL